MVAADAGATRPAAARAALPETKVRLFKIFLLGTDPSQRGAKPPERPGDLGGNRTLT